jgi:hypothetical protein
MDEIFTAGPLKCLMNSDSVLEVGNVFNFRENMKYVQNFAEDTSWPMSV